MHLRGAYRRRRCSRIEAVLAFFQVVASSQISPPFRARYSAHETHPQNYKKKSIPPNFPPNSRYPPPRIGPKKLPRHSRFFLIADLRRLGPRIGRRSFKFSRAHVADADRDHGLLTRQPDSRRLPIRKLPQLIGNPPRRQSAPIRPPRSRPWSPSASKSATPQ